MQTEQPVTTDNGTCSLLVKETTFSELSLQKDGTHGCPARTELVQIPEMSSFEESVYHLPHKIVLAFDAQTLNLEL